MKLLNILLVTQNLIQCVMETKSFCTCILCLVRKNCDANIPTIHCSCKLIIYKVLLLVDAFINKAFKCKCVVRRILLTSFCQLKENKEHINL
jgi:hypothetical protein